MWIKNVNNFQIVEVQPKGSICLIFCQFEPCIAYKNVAYKKSVYLNHQFFQFFLSSNLPYVYLLVFWFTLLITKIVLTLTQFVLYIC